MKTQRVKCDRHDPSDGGLHNSLSVAADERKLVSTAKNGDSVSFEILCKQSAKMVKTWSAGSPVESHRLGRMPKTLCRNRFNWRSSISRNSRAIAGFQRG